MELFFERSEAKDMAHVNRTHPRLPSSKPMEAFRTLARQILQYANRGILRAEFQRAVSKMILDFSGCDAVELWVKEHEKYFRCQAEHHRDQPSSLDVSPVLQDGQGRLIPGPEDDPHLFALCRHLLLGRTENTGPLPKKKDPLIQSQICNLPSQATYPSVLLVPLSLDHHPMGLLQLKSRRVNGFTRTEAHRYQELGNSLGIALAHRHAQIDLRERVKELSCLYDIARLGASPGISLEHILQDIAQLLPSAWLYPEIAFSRIVLDGHVYTTSHFKEGRQRQVSEIMVGEKQRGTVEVTYAEEKPELDEGPFLKEERNLIDTVAHELATLIKRKEAEEDQFKLQEQLRHADRLATIGQLAAGVAHELNEPLGNILGFAQLAKKCSGLPKQAEEDLEKILNASLNAREVIRKMLSFARPMRPQKQKVSLNQIIEEGLYFFESRCAKEGVQLLRFLSPELPEIFADPVQLNQVIVNLVINALQAMPRGGRLTIHTHPEGDHVFLTIEDTGTGMNEEVLKQIFTPFFTTKEVGLGTGLGLPVVHDIITSHGGTIHVDTQISSGTRFEIHFPIEGPPPSKGDER
jgi:two-component system NtrC family sensor kinase